MVVFFEVGEELKEMGDFGWPIRGYIPFQNNNAFGLSLSVFFVYISGLSDWFRDVVEVSISGCNHYIYESKGLARKGENILHPKTIVLW